MVLGRVSGWEGILNLGGNPGRKGSPSLARDVRREGRTATTPGFAATEKAQKKAQKNDLGWHMGCSAEPRNEPEPVWEKREKLEESERRDHQRVDGGIGGGRAERDVKLVEDARQLP
jgi:hypothetical protein